MANHYPFLKGVIGFLMILFILPGCAGPWVVKDDEKTDLRNRINEYWRYRIKGDAEKAYQFEVPSFREKYSILYYINRFKLVRYLEAEIQEIGIEGKEATGTVKLTYVMLLKRLTDKKLTKLEQEKWTKIKDTWYHVPGKSEMKKE